MDTLKAASFTKEGGLRGLRGLRKGNVTFSQVKDSSQKKKIPLYL